MQLTLGTGIQRGPKGFQASTALPGGTVLPLDLSYLLPPPLGLPVAPLSWLSWWVEMLKDKEAG